MDITKLRNKMKSFMTMNDLLPDILVLKEKEPGRRVVGVISFVDGQMQWRERVFDDNDELIARDRYFTPMTDADIERFAKKINRYMADYTMDEPFISLIHSLKKVRGWNKANDQ